MAGLLTVFTTSKAAYDLIEPLVSKLFTRLGWKKDDRRRVLVSAKIREVVREARIVVEKTPPDQVGSRLQALVDRLREELLGDGIPSEDAEIFTDQASAILVMVSFGSIGEWFELRGRLERVESALREGQALHEQARAAADKQLKLLWLMTVGATAIALSALLVGALRH